MHPCDAGQGLVDAVALEAAVAEDLPGLHAGEDVFDAGPDLHGGLVVSLFPGREFALAAFAAVRDDEAGARVAAVGDREGLADGGLGGRTLPTPCRPAGRIPPAQGIRAPGSGPFTDTQSTSAKKNSPASIPRSPCTPRLVSCGRSRPSDAWSPAMSSVLPRATPSYPGTTATTASTTARPGHAMTCSTSRHLTPVTLTTPDAPETLVDVPTSAPAGRLPAGGFRAVERRDASLRPRMRMLCSMGKGNPVT